MVGFRTCFDHVATFINSHKASTFVPEELFRMELMSSTVPLSVVSRLFPSPKMETPSEDRLRGTSVEWGTEIKEGLREEGGVTGGIGYK